MLTDFDTQIRRELYDGVMQGRRIPDVMTLASVSRASADEVRKSLRRLADAHMLVLQDSGEVLMANPFSAVPTPFVVSSERGSWYANCIWDAMGVAAMLREDVTLESSCGCCGTAMLFRMPAECRDEDERVAHFPIPAARWWDDIVFN